MQPLLDLFDSLKECFGDDERTGKLIDRQIRCTREWIDDNSPEERERSPRDLGKIETPEKPQGTRSIFDDIDVD